ncbi:hypothetical protein AB0I35_27440 [Nocardia sp. NPDC050378]|uniref:hypothetical protein n=1 Tax=Nocardia sp. NPDC050378 TaxID=3155400 RepID=UPI0033C8F466
MAFIGVLPRERIALCAARSSNTLSIVSGGTDKFCRASRTNDGPVTAILLTDQMGNSAGPLPVFATFEQILGERSRPSGGV